MRQRIIVRGDLLQRQEGYKQDHILSTDDTGKRLFAVTRAGLSVYEFAEMPLAVGGIYPAIASANAANLLKVRGTGIKPGAQVVINGQTLSATWLDGSTLQLNTPSLPEGTFSVEIVNPDGERATIPAALRVMLPRPVPVVSNVTPGTFTTRGTLDQIVVLGSNFVLDSQVLWNGSKRVTTFVGSGELHAQLVDGDLDTGGQVPVSVITPPVGGGTSNSVSVTVNNPVPVIQFFPVRILVGSHNYNLTVSGTGMLPVSTIRLNGQDIPTTIDSYGSLDSVVPDTLLSNTGQLRLTVFNPAPGGGESVAVTINVGPPGPSVTYPMKHDFGQILSGSLRTQYAWLYNSGQATLTGPQFQISGTNATEFKLFPDFCFGQDIPAGAGCGYTIQFAPTSPGVKTATLTMTDNMDNSPHIIPMTGEAITKPPDVFTSDETDLTDVGVTIHAGVNPNMADGTMWFEWGTSSTLASFTKTSPVAFTASSNESEYQVQLVGLSPSTTYYYRAVSQTTSGTNASQIANFRTLAPYFLFGVIDSNQRTVTAGQTASYQLTVQSSGAFNGIVTITCTGAPAGALCTPSPAAPNLANGASSNISVTVTTTAKQSATQRPVLPTPRTLASLFAFLGFGLVGICLLSKNRKVSASLWCLVLLVAITSCGGGGGQTTPVPPPAPPPVVATPPGSYTLTVTASSPSAVHTQTAVLVLNVN